MQTLQTLEQPASLSQQRIAYLESRRIDPKVASIDLEMVKMKMREPAEDLHWSTDQIEDAEVEYKRYLTLCILFPYPKHTIVPNKIMDTMWQREGRGQSQIQSLRDNGRNRSDKKKRAK